MTDVDRTSASRAAGEAIQRLLVSEGVIKGGQKPPTLAACIELGNTINSITGSWVIYGFAEGPLVEKVAKSLQELSELISQLDSSLPYGTVGGVGRDILEELSRVVELAKHQPWGRPLEKPPEQWKDFVEQLADAFLKAMRSSNSVKIGLTFNGPLARFLEMAISRYTGESPRRPTIIQHIRRRQAARKKKQA